MIILYGHLLLRLSVPPFAVEIWAIKQPCSLQIQIVSGAIDAFHVCRPIHIHSHLSSWAILGLCAAFTK